MAEPHTIYNCETCMFLTRNKKDYTRHLKTRKHLENHPTAASDADTATATDTDKDATHPSCVKCNKEFKSHTKKCNSGVAPIAPSPAQYDDPASLTPEQIQYILMENKILKELLVNAIQGHHQAAAAAASHSV
jgi:hypothetical protein